MISGAACTTVAIFIGLALGEQTHGIGVLLAQPAAVSVPVAFITMVAVSLRSPVPEDRYGPEMLALHAPEGLGLAEPVVVVAPDVAPA